MKQPAFAERVHAKTAEMFAAFTEANPAVVPGAQPPAQMQRDAAVLVIGEIIARIG
jgi:hypothetical protein